MPMGGKTSDAEHEKEKNDNVQDLPAVTDGRLFHNNFSCISISLGRSLFRDCSYDHEIQDTGTCV